MRRRWLEAVAIAPVAVGVLAVACTGVEVSGASPAELAHALDDDRGAPTAPDQGAPASRPLDPAQPDPAPTPTPDPAQPDPAPAPAPAPAPPADPGARSTDEPAVARPVWLGTRVLPLAPDGHGEVQPTPPELRDRRLPPPEHLPPPPDERFVARIEPVPGAVRDRSTWREGCPVALDELRYVTVSFWGFDDRPHTGELLVHHTAAEDLVGVFAVLFEARFPIEEMRIVAPAELDAPPTGDGNITTAFVCRPVVGASVWSQHASGLAVDINPFHNPYRRGERVLPELASAYLDRADHRPGMIQPGDVVTRAFDEIGWGWGGRWRSLDDWMHFSANGR